MPQTSSRQFVAHEDSGLGVIKYYEVELLSMKTDVATGGVL